MENKTGSKGVGKSLRCFGLFLIICLIICFSRKKCKSLKFQGFYFFDQGISLFSNINHPSIFWVWCSMQAARNTHWEAVARSEYSEGLACVPAMGATELGSCCSFSWGRWSWASFGNITCPWNEAMQFLKGNKKLPQWCLDGQEIGLLSALSSVELVK